MRFVVGFIIVLWAMWAASVVGFLPAAAGFSAGVLLGLAIKSISTSNPKLAWAFDFIVLLIVTAVLISKV